MTIAVNALNSLHLVRHELVDESGEDNKSGST